MCGDRRENDSGVTAEIEVTPEMTKAGAKALQDWYDGKELEGGSPWETGARSIYQAMRDAIPAGKYALDIGFKPRDLGPDRPALEIPDEMLDAAMRRLHQSEHAWEYVDRDMMREILMAALLGIKRAP